MLGSLSLTVDTRCNFATNLFDSIFSIIVWTNRVLDFDEGNPNPKRFRFYGIFKKLQFDNIGGSRQILKFS